MESGNNLPISAVNECENSKELGDSDTSGSCVNSSAPAVKVPAYDPYSSPQEDKAHMQLGGLPTNDLPRSNLTARKRKSSAFEFVGLLELWKRLRSKKESVVDTSAPLSVDPVPSTSATVSATNKIFLLAPDVGLQSRGIIIRPMGVLKLSNVTKPAEKFTKLLFGNCFKYGFMVASYPFIFIAICIAIAVIFSVLVIGVREERNAEKLWATEGSDFVRGSAWLMEHFPNRYRFQFMMFVGDDVLQPKVIQEMLRVHENVTQARFGGSTYPEICARMPILKFGRSGRRKRSLSSVEESGESGGVSMSSADPSSPRVKRGLKEVLLWWKYKRFDFSKRDPTSFMERQDYCHLATRLDTECWSQNLMQLWRYDAEVIDSLTKEDIITAIISTKKNPVYGVPEDFSKLLGGATYDANGTLVSAKAVRMMWVVEVNRSAITDEDRNINAPQIYVADKRTAEWEDDYIDFFLSYTGLQGYRMYFYSMRSFLIVTVETILDDLGMLIVGYVLVFVFVVLILGRRSCVESRWILSALGMASVAFSTLTAIGLCHRMGFVYGSMHRAMPFVLLGIGIDDMFVIIQAFENLPKKELSGKSLRTRVGLTMEHAGVAITITSVTDFAAFVIGATTIIPALRSFCVYTAVGILVLYIFQSCFFVACFTLDQRRMESGRNGFLFCFKQPDGCGPRMECAKYDLIMIFFRDFYSPVLLKPLGKILVSLFTLGFLAWSIYGFYHLEQMFDRIWMLPESSYLHQYFKHSKIYYPSHWEMGALLVGSVDYPEELGNIHRVVTELRSEPTMRHVNSWTNDFIPYVNTYWNASAPDVPLPEDQFHSLLSLFLFSPKGGKYTHQFEFNGTLDCLSPAPPIIASRIDFEYKPMSGPHEHIPAMRRVKTAVLNSQITTGDQFVLSWARAYGNWEIDEIIQEELYRNIGLAMVCVFVVTLGLLGNIWTCLIVLSCVVMTLISVAGLMYNWGVTIDTVSCICMVLAIGLSVDYSAHVGHTFMTVSGTRDRRAALTLTRIGPAVFSGGFSTFLAFAALFTSQSHVFKTFFKIFFGVVIFGLYYALCFLPVFLSWFGPAPYQAGLREDYGEEMEDRGGMSCKENLEAGVVLIEARNGSLDGDLSKKTGARDPIKSSAEMTEPLPKYQEADTVDGSGESLLQQPNSDSVWIRRKEDCDSEPTVKTS